MSKIIALINADIDEVRKKLHTKSLRTWMKTEFWPRTKLIFAALPVAFYRSYTTGPTYVVRIYQDDGESGLYEEVHLSEEEIREQWGDELFDAINEAGPGQAVDVGTMESSDWGDILEGDDLNNLIVGSWKGGTEDVN